LGRAELAAIHAEATIKELKNELGDEKENPENQKDADRSSQENEGRPKGVLRPRAHDFGQKLEEPEAIVLQIVS